jgi:hypothetical protein
MCAKLQPTRSHQKRNARRSGAKRLRAKPRRRDARREKAAGSSRAAGAHQGAAPAAAGQKTSGAKVTEYKNRIVAYGEETADQLLANPYNWRIHTQMQQQAMDAVLDEVGIVQNVIVNQTTGHVLDGHMRIDRAMRKHEQHPLPVTYVRLSEDEERRVLATFDSIGALAGRDEAKAKELIAAQSPEPDALRVLFSANLSAERVKAKVRELQESQGRSGDFSKDKLIVIVEVDDKPAGEALMERLVEDGYTARIVSSSFGKGG